MTTSNLYQVPTKLDKHILPVTSVGKLDTVNFVLYKQKKKKKTTTEAEYISVDCTQDCTHPVLLPILTVWNSNSDIFSGWPDPKK